MMIELSKQSRHCTIAIQTDLLGQITILQIATRLFAGRKGIYKKEFTFDDLKLANDFLFTLEVRYRQRGYIYC
jgi:hypothetical protein